MESWFARTGGGDPARLADDLPGPGRPLTLDDSADCCPARPLVTVLMPPTAGRPLTADLRLCGHHYRVSSAALRACAAMVYDATGAVIAPGDDGRLPVLEPPPPPAPPARTHPPAWRRRMTPPG
jgi:hypothetical protein